MIKLAFAVYDAKLQAFGMPVYEDKEAVAVRSFTDAVNRPSENSNLYNHPEDYSLWLIGKYDDERGAFENIKQKNIIGGASISNKINKSEMAVI